LAVLGSALAKGHAFIDKSNLNGESKLECEFSLVQTRPFTKDDTAVQTLSLAITYEPPNKRFDRSATPRQFGGGALSQGMHWHMRWHAGGEGYAIASHQSRSVRRINRSAAHLSRAGSAPHSCPSPSLSLSLPLPSSFRGQCSVGMGGDSAEFSVDGKSLMMRETNLRNCDFIYGLVVYTGNDTKIQRSNLEGEKPKTKVSYIMRQVNVYLIWMLALQSVLCLIGGILAGINRGGFTSDMWFLHFDSSSDKAPDAPSTGVFAFFSWFILLSQMVPISLIVSAEMVKFAQSLFIEQDIQLYYEPLNKPTKCNSSTIHEDLGLIDYVFSDKVTRRRTDEGAGCRTQRYAW